MPNTYKAWEPPKRSELPQNDARIVSFSRGAGQKPIVTVDGAPLAHRIRYHSPDGFEFGYMGSGPSELALNLLALVVSEPEAFRLHIPFKFAILRSIGFAGGLLEMRDVVEWIRGTYAKEIRDPSTILQENAMREAFESGDADPLEAPATIEETHPPYEVELIKECADPGCKECRTGETAAETFFENVRRLLERPKDFTAWSDIDMMIVDRHFEGSGSPHLAAQEIAVLAAGLNHPAPPEVSQNRIRPPEPDPVWRNLDPDSDNFAPSGGDTPTMERGK